MRGTEEGDYKEGTHFFKIKVKYITNPHIPRFFLKVIRPPRSRILLIPLHPTYKTSSFVSDILDVRV